MSEYTLVFIHELIVRFIDYCDLFKSIISQLFNTLPKTSLMIRHMLSRQFDERKVLSVQRNPWDDDFDFNVMLKTAFNNFLMMT